MGLVSIFAFNLIYSLCFDFFKNCPLCIYWISCYKYFISQCSAIDFCVNHLPIFLADLG